MPKRKAQHLPTDSKRRSRSKPRTIPVTVPFTSGFRLPDKRQTFRATGIDSKHPDPEFIPTDAFRPVPAPVSDLDWLANYREDGQSYYQWLLTNRWLKGVNNTPDKRCNLNPAGHTIPERYADGKIYLLPLGDFGDETSSSAKFDVHALAEYTRIFYGLPVDVLQNIPVEFCNGKVIAKLSKRKDEENQEEVVSGCASNEGGGDLAFDDIGRATRHDATSDDIELTTRYDATSGHYQVRVDTGLLGLRTLMPKDGLLMVVISLLDVYQSPTDLFVAGIGSAASKMGYFSFFRYDPALSFSEEDWFDYTIDANCKQSRRKLQLQRCCKLLVHEIGHIFGIGHCIYFSCVMNGSGNLQEDYRQPHHLCPVDLRKVQSLCGVDVISRYDKLTTFYDNLDMHDEADWVRARVDDIRKRKKELSNM